MYMVAFSSSRCFRLISFNSEVSTCNVVSTLISFNSEEEHLVKTNIRHMSNEQNIIKSEPQGLVHQNKFVRNKEPLYVLHEDKVVFTRIVKTSK